MRAAVICRWLLIGSLFVGLSGEPAALVTFAFVGDVMLGRGVAQDLAGAWTAAFADVQGWLAEVDVAFANLESPLTTAPQIAAGYDLRAPPQAATALRAGGFDVVSLANNHALDAGQAGLEETLAALQAAGIEAVLPQRELVRPRYRLLAFDDSVEPLDMQASAAAVEAAARRAEWVIVSAHWGGEYQAAPSARQQAMAQIWAQAGADIIIGHGPHVLQRIERIGETLVAYSLGNFLFDQLYPLDCRQGVILRVTVRGHRIIRVEPVPTVIERRHVRPADAGEAAAILRRLYPRAFFYRFGSN